MCEQINRVEFRVYIFFSVWNNKDDERTWRSPLLETRLRWRQIPCGNPLTSGYLYWQWNRFLHLRGRHELSIPTIKNSASQMPRQICSLSADVWFISRWPFQAYAPISDLTFSKFVHCWWTSVIRGKCPVTVVFIFFCSAIHYSFPPKAWLWLLQKTERWYF